MGELGKMPEVTEMKTPAVEGFRDIKPESGMSVQEAKNFWNETFDAMENGPEKIQCLNEKLAGKKHPETDVAFEKKIVEVDGKQYEVVVPQFESQFDVQLPDDKLQASDRDQFGICNEALKKGIAEDGELRNKFDEEQIEQIENGETPDGYTWHHDAEVGKMQLVDTETHQKTAHTGGRRIWGGGTEQR